MPEKKTYLVDGSTVDVNIADVNDFLKNVPNAIEAQSFIVNGDTVDVALTDVNDFLANVKDAKPLYSDNTMGKSQPEVGSSPSSGMSTQLPELELTTAIRFRKDMQGARSAKDIEAIFNKPEYKGMKQYAETFKGLSPQDAMQKMRETPISPSSQKAISYLSKEPAKFYAEQRDETIKGANLAATNIIQARESAKASEQLLDGAGQMLVQYQQTNDPTPIIEMLGQFGIQADESNWEEESQRLINTAQEQLRLSAQSEQENMKVYDLASKQSETFDRAVVAYNNDVIRRESKSAIGKYAFQDYIVNYDDIVKAKEKDKAQEEEAKLQGAFGRMVDSFTGVSNLITKSLAAVDYMDRQWYAAAMGNENDLRDALEDSYLKQMDILELEMPNADAERLSKDYFGSANPADWNWYKIGNDVGQVTGSMIPIMAASLVNPALAVGAGTGLVYGDLFESAKKGGMEDNQAALFAGTLSTTIGGLERMSGVPVTKYFQGELGKRLAARYAKDLLTTTSVKDITKAAITVAFKGAQNMVGEISTEAAQQAAEGGSKMLLNEAGFDFQDAPESLGELGSQMVDVAKSTAVGIVPTIGVGTVRTSRNAMKQIKRNTVMNHIIEIKQDPEFITNKIEYLGTQRELGKIDEKTYEGEVKALTEINDVVELYPTVSNDNLAGISELYSEKLALQEMDAKRVEKGLPKSNDKRISDIDKQIVTLSQNENQDNQIQAQEDGESTPMPEGVKVEGANTQTDEKLRNEEGREKGRQESLLEPENVGGEKAPSVSESLSSGGIFVKDGKSGSIRLDGQTVVFETKDEIIELGNKNEVENASISEFNIEKELPLNIEVNNDNTVSVDGKKYVNNFSNPQAAINRDLDGNVVSVNLETENGQKRTFRGQKAEEIAYQYTLKEFEQNATDETIGKLEEEVTRLEEAAAKPATEAKKRSVTKRNEAKPKAVEQLLGKPKEAAQTSAIKPEIVTEKEVAETAKKTGITPKNLRDLYNINRELFGLDRIKSFASAIAMDRMVGVMAKRAGITKAEMYGRLKFEKDTEENVLKADNALFQGTVDGKPVTLRNLDVDVVNGFYSPIEKNLKEYGKDKIKAKDWLNVVGKGDEAVFTGVRAFLEGKDPNAMVSKQEILDYMKDNRISVVEVVRGEDVDVKKEKIKKEFEKQGYEISQDMSGEIEITKDEELVEDPEDELPEDLYALAQEYYSITEGTGGQDTTKFSQYQLEGEKENYKEVLVTLPKEKGLLWKQNKAGLWAYFVGDKQVSDGVPDDTYKEIARKTINSRDILESRKADFKSTHFDEPNILVHLRMNTRTDADGNKVLFLEEVQSDWGQTGKKEGFAAIDRQVAEKERLSFVEKIRNKYDNKALSDIDGKNIWSAEEKSEYDRLNKLSKGENVPTAPFVTDTNAWTKLGLKVALKEAVKQGADKIAWTTGEQQNDRYDLSKQVDDVYTSSYGEEWVGGKFEKRKDVEITIKGGEVKKFVVNNTGKILSGDFVGERLDNVIGKEMAEKILSAENDINFGTQDLKVGGKGMKGFYGSMEEGTKGIVGGVAEKVFGQNLKMVDIVQGDKLASGYDVTIKDENGRITTHNFDTKSKGLAWLSKQKNIEIVSEKASEKITSTQPSIDITPALRAEVERGLALFQRQQGQQAKGAMVAADGAFVIYALSDPNVSTPLHEMAHVFEHYLTDAERAAVQSWAGTKAWTTQTSEKFARGFEKYLADGKAPAPALQRVFDKFKQWLTDIYNGITKSEIDIELNEQMRDIYAKMLGAKATAAAPKAEVSKQVQPESKAAAAPELADVESTAKALEVVDKDPITKNIKGVPLTPLEIDGYKRKPAEQYSINDANSISEAYHAAKKDGSNPKLVKAVEELLTPNTNAKEQQSFSMREQSVQETTKRSSDSDLPKVNETKLSDGEKAAEQKEVAESKPKESAETKAERRKRELAELKKAASDVRKVDGIDAFEQAKRKALADRAILDFHIKNIKEDIGDAIKTIKDYAKSIGESIDEIMQDAWDVVTNNTPIPNKYNEPKKLRSASLATEINRTLRVKNAPIFVATQKAVNKAFAIGEAQAREEFVQSMKDLKSDFKEFIEYFTEQAKEEAKSKLDSKSAKFKAFREGQKAFAKVFNDTLKSAQEKNFITPFEYRMLARRASLAQTEGQWNKLMDLTNRVLSDASYRQKLAEAERLQKQAKQKKHGQATEEVKRFTRISPEDIDINKLDEYIAALGDLTLPIPKYGKMQAIVFDIEDNFRRSNPDLFTGRTDSSISGSEKVNKAFERASEAFDNVMESLNKDAITVDDYRYAVKQAGIALRNLDMVIADMRTMYEDGKLTSEALEEAENMYLDVLDSIGTSVADLSAKFPSQIDQLVTELVNQVNDNLPKIDKSTLTNSEKDMLKKLELYNSADLKKLSPIELDFYNQLIENFLNEGYFDMQRFKAVQSALFAATNKDKTVKFVNDIKQVFDDRFDNMPTTNRLAAQVSASWQGALTGFGKLFAGAFDVGFISPIMTSLKKADEETRKIVREFRDLQKKHGIQESPIFGKESYRERAHRIGMVAAYLREYGLVLSGEPRKVDKKEGGQMEGERDVFRMLGEYEIEDKDGKPKMVSRDKGGNYDYGSKTDDKKLDQKIYKTFPKSKKVNQDGRDFMEVDPKEVYDSIFTDPNNKFLNAKERSFLIEYYELLEKTRDLQQAANAMRGLPFKPVTLYSPRQRYSIGTKTIATPFPILKGGRISLRGSSGKEVVTEELSAMNNNIFDVFMQNAEETMRDYYVTSAVMDVNSLYKSIMPEIENDNGKYVKAMMDKISDSLNDHYTFPPKDIVQRGLSALNRIGTFRIFVNIARTAYEIASFSTFGVLRMGTGFKSYRNFGETVKVRSQVTLLMNDVNSMFTGSMISKDIEFKEGRIEAEKFNTYFTRMFASAAESMFKRMLWYTRFQQEFKQKTGKKFDMDKYESSLDYRKKHREAIEEAKVQSDKSFEFIAGSPVRAGRRKAARLLPIAGTKAVIDIDTLAGQALSLFSAYPFRGAIQAVDGLTDLKNEPSLKRANDAKNAILGTLGEQLAYGFATTAGGLALALTFTPDDDEEEKERIRKEIDELFTLNELGLETLASAVGMLSASANGAGRIFVKVVGTLAYSASDDKDQKEMIVKFLQKVQYGKLTDYSKIKNDLKLKQAIYIDLIESSGFLGLTELARVTVDSYNAYKDYEELMDLYEKGTPAQKEKAKDAIIMAYLFVKAVNIIGALGAFKGMAFNINSKSLNQLANQQMDDIIPSRGFENENRSAVDSKADKKEVLELNQLALLKDADESTLQDSLINLGRTSEILIEDYKYNGEEYLETMKNRVTNALAKKLDSGGKNIEKLTDYNTEQQLDTDKAYETMFLFANSGDKQEKTLRIALLKTMLKLPKKQEDKLKAQVEGGYDNSYYTSILKNDAQTIFEFIKFMKKQNKS